MRLTVRTNLAMRTLMFCAVHAPNTVRKSDLARSCNGSEAHFGLVVNKLGQTGFVQTLRGRNGGIRLNRPADDITVGQVFRTFEANTPFAECFKGGEDRCPIKAVCALRPVLASALEAFYSELDKVTLANLVDGNHGLSEVLALDCRTA